MAMLAYTPTTYACEVWGDTVTSKTIINWIRTGHELPGVARIEKTPTGRYRLFADDKTPSNVLSLVEEMRARAA